MSCCASNIPQKRQEPSMTREASESGLQGHVAIVTGAARGIGAAYARGLADAGCKLAVLDLAGESVEAVARSLGNDAMAIQVDVADAAAMSKAADQVHARYGRIDILVNNAAIFADDVAGFAALGWDVLDGDMNQWRRMRSVNVEGVLNGARAVAPYMRARRYGRIISQSSVGAFVDSSSIYGLSKLEVAALTRMLAYRLGRDGITVNAIAPGMIGTDAVTQRASRTVEETRTHMEQIARLSPVGRIGMPEDLMSTLLFFASPRSEYVNGQVLLVDGGWIRHF
jgi:NAD(P)-dependent dehydrogenase (short-subunit alcohol dehydrogenase family)